VTGIYVTTVFNNVPVVFNFLFLKIKIKMNLFMLLARELIISFTGHMKTNVNTVGSKEEILNHSLDKMICPFVQDPFSECYCVRMGSQDIEKAIYFCSKNFISCELYKTGSFGKAVTLCH